VHQQTVIPFVVISFGHISYSADTSGRSPAEIAGSNPARSMYVCCECFVLSGRGLGDEVITRPDESY
jgi:hypothetical protein